MCNVVLIAAAIQKLRHLIRLLDHFQREDIAENARAAEHYVIHLQRTVIKLNRNTRQQPKNNQHKDNGTGILIAVDIP